LNSIKSQYKDQVKNIAMGAVKSLIAKFTTEAPGQGAAPAAQNQNIIDWATDWILDNGVKPTIQIIIGLLKMAVSTSAGIPLNVAIDTMCATIAAPLVPAFGIGAVVEPICACVVGTIQAFATSVLIDEIVIPFIRPLLRKALKEYVDPHAVGWLSGVLGEFADFLDSLNGDPNLVKRKIDSFLDSHPTIAGFIGPTVREATTSGVSATVKAFAQDARACLPPRARPRPPARASSRSWAAEERGFQGGRGRRRRGRGVARQRAPREHRPRREVRLGEGRSQEGAAQPRRRPGRRGARRLPRQGLPQDRREVGGDVRGEEHRLPRQPPQQKRPEPLGQHAALHRREGEGRRHGRARRRLARPHDQLLGLIPKADTQSFIGIVSSVNKFIRDNQETFGLKDVPPLPEQELGSALEKGVKDGFYAQAKTARGSSRSSTVSR